MTNEMAIYKLKKREIDSRRKKYGLSERALSLMVTDGRQEHWLHNRTMSGRETLATKEEAEKVAEVLMCNMTDIAYFVEEKDRKTTKKSKAKSDDEIILLLREILKELKVWSEPIGTEETHD